MNTVKASSTTILTASNVAERYGVKVTTVYQWTTERKIPFHKIPHHRTFYILEELEMMERGEWQGNSKRG